MQADYKSDVRPVSVRASVCRVSHKITQNEAAKVIQGPKSGHFSPPQAEIFWGMYR